MSQGLKDQPDDLCARRGDPVEDILNDHRRMQALLEGMIEKFDLIAETLHANTEFLLQDMEESRRRHIEWHRSFAASMCNPERSESRPDDSPDDGG